MDGTRTRARRVSQVVAAGLIAGLMVACVPEDGQGTGKGPASKAPGSAPSKPGGKEPSEADTGGEGPGAPSKKPSAEPSGKPGGDSGSSSALTCDQLRNAELQTGSFELPDAAPPGPIRLTNGLWEGGGVRIELQPQCGIGDVTGSPAADAVGAIKVYTEGTTGRFFTLVTWRNEGGTPVPAAAAALGDRTPVVSIDIPAAGGLRQATVLYRTRGEDDPLAVVTLTRTAVYEVSGATMVELHHSDAPYTP